MRQCDRVPSGATLHATEALPSVTPRAIARSGNSGRGRRAQDGLVIAGRSGAEPTGGISCAEAPDIVRPVTTPERTMACLRL
ncbi:hypothetical protein GCM10007859_09310 [Brevundimonas denitrificans]|uniref:Uncharacterized protein n=1 Tax=Brevundimonas denitrificans TaxID=1443434 RepID=A0ABQ6BG54_9CAUL|nr:hypothetical protein GCM10007859_09310 [Brevundimonas denitrificans]